MGVLSGGQTHTLASRVSRDGWFVVSTWARSILLQYVTASRDPSGIPHADPAAAAKFSAAVYGFKVLAGRAHGRSGNVSIKPISPLRPCAPARAHPALFSSL